MKTHELKTWPSYFEAIQKREKLFEVRKNDRDFSVGDKLRLREFDPGKDAVINDWKYTKREQTVIVTSILHGGQFGIEPGYCVMSIAHPVETQNDKIHP